MEIEADNSLATAPPPAGPNSKLAVMGAASAEPGGPGINLRTTQTIAVLSGASSLTVTSCVAPVNAISVHNEKQNQGMKSDSFFFTPCTSIAYYGHIQVS